MSYHVDSKTLLFDDLTKHEATALYDFVNKLVMEGFVNCQHPAFVSWLAAARMEDHRALLVYSTAFPQRALISMVRHLGKALATEKVESAVPKELP